MNVILVGSVDEQEKMFENLSKIQDVFKDNFADTIQRLVEGCVRNADSSDCPYCGPHGVRRDKHQDKQNQIFISFHL